MAIIPNRETISCKWCEEQILYVGTKMCNRCWELDTRISCDLDLAERMVKHFKGQRISKIILRIIEDAKETHRFKYGDRGDRYVDIVTLTGKLVDALKGELNA